METARPATRLPFGRLLMRFRLAAGLSQETLAERAGVSWRTVSDLERGVNQRPRGSTFRLLVAALGLTAEEHAALREAALPLDAAVMPPPKVGPQPAVPTNLPLLLTSFIGREPDVDTVRQLLGKTRLLTLTGAGGCGKTRLALEVAQWAAQTSAYTDGIWLVALAPLSDEAVLVPTVAAVLGARERTGERLLETLTTFLRPKQVLLLLDNCEHLVLACAQLADALLRGCPRLTILATSREPLSIGGERPWPVPSLRLPDPRRVRTLAAVAACEAVQLFVQRAQVVRPAFTLTEQNSGLAEQICRRLDGIPLAIELAAARLSSLSLEQILARLDDRFRLLTGGSRTALPRQQTLRATLDWSHDLLSDRERLLLRRLSEFAGGWVLEAAEAVCVGHGIEAEEVLDLLAGLVAKSLVAPTEGRAGSRYGLLETMRQYGREKLVTAGEERALRDRHLTWYLALAEQAAQRIGGAERELWLDRLEAELENLRSALRWSSLEEGRYEAGLRLAAALEDFWYVRGYVGEGRRWLEELLARAGSVSAVFRARALAVVALLTYCQADYGQAMTYFESAHAL